MRLQLGLLLTFLALAGPSAATAGEGDEPQPRSAQRVGSAWDRLRDDPQHATFVRLAEQVGLDVILDGEHAVTVLAPTEAAFDGLAEEDVDRLTATNDTSALRARLGMHLLWGQLDAEEVAGVLMTSTIAGGSLLIEPRPAPDDTVALAADARFLADRVVVRSGSDGVLGDRTTNGVLYRVDELLGEASPDLQPLRHAPRCDSTLGGPAGKPGDHRHGRARGPSDAGGDPARRPSRNGPAGGRPGASGGSAGSSFGSAGLGESVSLGPDGGSGGLDVNGDRGPIYGAGRDKLRNGGGTPDGKCVCGGG